MTWADAGFPDIEFRPWGKVFYALFLGLKELASAMGYDMTLSGIYDAETFTPTDYMDQISSADYSKVYPAGQDQHKNMPSGLAEKFDYWFLQLLYKSFSVQYACDHLVFEPTNAQTLTAVNDFLGEELITGSTGRYFDLTAGFWTAWAKQRYRLIRNMPIYSFYPIYTTYDQRINFYYTNSAQFKAGEWIRTIDFTHTWEGVRPDGHWYGYTIDYKNPFWDTRYLSAVQVVQLQQPAYPFEIQFVYRANMGDYDFGTGLHRGQVWTEKISGFGSRNYSYVFPPGNNQTGLSQDTQIYIRALPHNNPWITGGI